MNSGRTFSRSRIRNVPWFIHCLIVPKGCSTVSLRRSRTSGRIVRRACMPGDEVWLVGERRSTGEQKYYVSNLPADATIKTLAATIKARWACEQAHQQLKEELGLDHFEGRSWTGLHRHALMTMIAYAFLQSRRLKAAEGGKKNPRPSAPAKPPSYPPGHPH